MSKRLLSVFLVLCMLASVLSGMVALASEPIYTTSSIFFGYVADGAWTDATALEAGKTLTSKIEVSKTGDAEKMIFALVVYDANKLISADTATKSVAGDTVEFETKVTLPADVTDTHVVAVLWDNVDDMKAIANSSIFPGGSSELQAIKINGEELAGFKPEVKEYSYEIDTSKGEVAPVVEAIPVDGGANVVVGEATGFPGTVKIIVTAPGGATTDTYFIKYTLAGGKTGKFIEGEPEIMTGNIIPQAYAGGGAANPTALFVEGGLKVGSAAYSDRAYTTTEIMDESLIGLDKIIGGIGWYNATTPTATAFKSSDVLPWLNFTLTRGATVMVFFSDNEVKAAPRFAQYGYELETNKDGYFTNTLNAGVVMKHVHKFYRHYKAGEKVTVPNCTQGNNTYTIVLSYDPFGYVAPINHTALSEIKIDGVAMADFTEDIKSYDYALPAGQKDIPEVTVTTLDPNATAVVSNPTSFPGKTTITVKCEGYEDSVYVIDYSVEGTGNIKMLSTYDDEEIKWDGKVPSMRENLQNADQCWADRDNNNMAFSGLDDSLKGKIYILGCLDWQNGPTTANYKKVWSSKEFVPNMYTFDLGRTATVSVISVTDPSKDKGLAFAESGWEATKGDVPYAKGYTNTTVNFNYKYTKKIEVTDKPVTVSMPNLGGNPYFVVIDYATYESLEGITPDMIPSTELTTLTLDGTEIEGFSAMKTEYNVALTTQKIPVVAASALYKDAKVTVTQATAIPGTATVTVEAEGLDTATYTVNFSAKVPDGYVEGMTISNDNIEMRTTKRPSWNPPLNQDNYTHVYKKTINVEEGSTKTITLEIANKPYQKGTIILRPTDTSLENKNALVYEDGSAINWVNDTNVSRAYDYENYPEYNVAGVTYGKKSEKAAVTLGSGKTLNAFDEMFAADDRYVSGARTHYTRYPINAQVAMGGILPEWENCNYIVFDNYYGDGTQLPSETVTFTVDKSVEVIFVTSAANVTVKEVDVDDAGWTAEAISGVTRIYMNWVDSITVAYLIYNGYITETDVIGNYGDVAGTKGIIIRDRSALKKFIADWKAENGAEPVHGVQLKDADKAKTGFTNDTSTYHHDVFLYAWKEATGGEGGEGGETPDEPDDPVVPPATAGATELKAITVDGKAVSGFAPSTYGYIVTIPENQADFPVVAYTKADDGATVTVTNPTEFPGKAVITVSKSGEETKTYTLTYSVGNLISDLKLSDKAGIDSTHSVWPTLQKNFQEGDILYLGRSYKVGKINDTVAVGKDRIMTAVGWGSDVANNYAKVFGGTEVINDWVNFKALRDMDVIVYDDNGVDAEKFTNLGYTRTTDNNCYVYALLNLVDAATNKYNEAKHVEKYVKHYAAGETVQVPNAARNQTYLIVLDYHNYASLDAGHEEEPGEEPDEPDDPVVPPVTAGATQLTALSVNGTAVAGFAPSTYEYTVAIPGNQADFPVVTFTKADEAAEVELTQPTYFPGKAVLTVTKSGEEAKTYTITYTAETKVTDFCVMNNNVIPAQYAGTETDWTYSTAANHYPKYVQGGFEVGMTAWGDRSYKVTEIGEAYKAMLEGKDVIKNSVESWNGAGSSPVKKAFQSNDTLDWYNFKVTRDATIRVFKETNKDEAKLLAKGFTAVPAISSNNPYFIIIRDANYNIRHIYQYTKKVSAGEAVVIPNAREQTPNAYTVIIDYDTYDSLEEDEPEAPAISTKLAALTVDGKAVADFDADTLTYNVELPYGTTSATVAATAEDAQATVTVTQATAIPGTATIVVSGEGSDDTTYTVNITVAQPVVVDPVQNVKMRESYNGEPLTWGGAIAKYKTNLQVDDYCYSDRSGAMKWSYVAPEFVGKDWIQGALNWPNGGTNAYTALWNSADTEEYYTFDLHKSALVTLVTSSTAKGAYLAANGWIYETNTTDGYLVGYTNTAVKYTHKYSKYVDASEGPVTVSIPNVKGTSATVILDYDAEPIASTVLSDLTVDGVTVEDFDPNKKTYSVEILAGSELPVVDCTVADTNATATVEQATEVPGTATVTVKGFEGQEDTVYTINFIKLVVKKISDSDLEARTSLSHTEGAIAVMYNKTNDAKYAFKKAYDVAEGETKTITLSTNGLTKQYTSIVVVPADPDADKNVIVTEDGDELTWAEYKTGTAGTNGVSVAAYDYQNEGDEDFNLANASFTKFSTNGVKFTVDGAQKAAWVVEKMNYSDDAFVNGAPAVTDRNPSGSGICWVEFPAEWEDCNYITFPSIDLNGTNGGEITFTVNAPVEVILFTANANATVKDSEDTENWAKEDVEVARRYMHGIDHLSIAYMLNKGYMRESDITQKNVAFASYAGNMGRGFYIRRYDALIKMEEDFGGNYGVGIKPENLEATGFVNKGEEAKGYYLRDYNYTDFLDAWVEEELEEPPL